MIDIRYSEKKCFVGAHHGEPDHANIDLILMGVKNGKPKRAIKNNTRAT